MAHGRPVPGATSDFQDLLWGVRGRRAQGPSENRGGEESLQVLTVEFGQVAREGIALSAPDVSSSMAQDEGFGRGTGDIVPST